MFIFKKFKLLSLLLVPFLVSIALCPIDIQASGKEIKTVRVGYYQNEAFEDGASEGAVKKGYAYEYYRKLSEYTGWDYEYVYGDFADVYQMLLDGEVDLVAGLAYTEEREGLIGYPSSPMGSVNYSLVKHDNDDTINMNTKSLNGKRIGVLKSAIKDALVSYLEEKNIAAVVVEYNDYDSLLADFDKKNIDVLAAENDGVYDRSHAEVLQGFGGADYYLCVNINKPELLDELNMAQKALMADDPNYISYLRTKYYPTTIASRAFSYSEKEWIGSNTDLKIGYLNNFMPFSDTDENGNPIGLVSEVFEDMFEEMGISNIKFTYTGYDNYEDMVEAIANDEIEVAFPVGGGLFYSEEDGMFLSNNVISAQSDLIYLDDYLGTTISDFAINENNKLQYYYVAENFPNVSISKYPSTEACLDAVLSGEVTCTVLNGLRANYYLKQCGYDKLSFRQLPYNDQVNFGVKIGNDGLLKLLNRGISIVGSDNITNKIYDYTIVSDTPSLMKYFREYFWVTFIILLFFASIIIFIMARDFKRNKKQLEENDKNRAKLEKISSDKTIFLKNMAFDMRAPMNAIIGLTDLVKHSESQEETNKYVDKMSLYNEQLLSIINNVLDMSRIESGQVVLKEEVVNIRELMSYVRAAASASAVENHQIINVNIKDIRHVNVIGDKMRMGQVFLNIMNSASAHVKQGGIIDFSVEELYSEDKDTAKFEFCINGSGKSIDPEVLKAALDPYSHSERLAEKGIGTDFGFAISKYIVDMMGGTIDFYAMGDDGNKCVVQLPLKISDLDMVRDDSSDNREIDGYNFYGKRALIVEDTLPNQMMAGKIMNKIGLEVQIANDNYEAYAKLIAAPSGYFDVILLSENIYKEKGEDFTRTVNSISDPIKAEIPILPISSDINILVEALSKLFG